MYLYGKTAILRLAPVVYYISLKKTCSCDLLFKIFLNVCILNTNTWIAIIKFGGHHASKFGITYSNGGHIGFNYTHTSLIQELLLLILIQICPRYMPEIMLRILYLLHYYYQLKALVVKLNMFLILHYNLESLYVTNLQSYKL